MCQHVVGSKIGLFKLGLVPALVVLQACQCNRGTPQPPVDLRARTQAAVDATFRVACRNLSVGSGFLHASGRVITAAHVPRGCAVTDLSLWPASNKPINVTSEVHDDKLDVALLTPADVLPGGYKIKLPLDSVAFGEAVEWWGFPDGYPGVRPLLSMGYLAGEAPQEPNGTGPLRIWISGAFNHGNSGGPLLEYETGEVIGIVDATVTPLPLGVESALHALGEQRSGVIYTEKHMDGSTVSWTEGQIVGAVLDFLHKQTQLGIGLAVHPRDLVAFLKSQNISP